MEIKQGNFGMEKFDETENYVHEVDTNFSIMKKKRPAQRSKEEVLNLIKILNCPLSHVLIYIQLIAGIELADNKIALQKLQCDLVSSLDVLQ